MVFNAHVYGAIYAQAWWGAFLWRVYMADLIGVNGAFLKNVHKIA